MATTKTAEIVKDAVRAANVDHQRVGMADTFNAKNDVDPFECIVLADALPIGDSELHHVVRVFNRDGDEVVFWRSSAENWRPFQIASAVATGSTFGAAEMERVFNDIIRDATPWKVQVFDLKDVDPDKFIAEVVPGRRFQGQSRLLFATLN